GDQRSLGGDRGLGVGDDLRAPLIRHGRVEHQHEVVDGCHAAADFSNAPGASLAGWAPRMGMPVPTSEPGAPLRQRIRWNNVVWAFAAVAATALVGAWPRIAPSQPALPGAARPAPAPVAPAAPAPAAPDLTPPAAAPRRPAVTRRAPPRRAAAAPARPRPRARARRPAAHAPAAI